MFNLPIISSRKIFTLLVIAILAVVFLSLKPLVFAATGIPRTINFQGKLVSNSSGVNVSDTTYSVVFTLYDKSSGEQLFGLRLNQLQQQMESSE